MKSRFVFLLIFLITTKLFAGDFFSNTSEEDVKKKFNTSDNPKENLKFFEHVFGTPTPTPKHKGSKYYPIEKVKEAALTADAENAGQPTPAATAIPGFSQGELDAIFKNGGNVYSAYVTDGGITYYLTRTIDDKGVTTYVKSHWEEATKSLSLLPCEQTVFNLNNSTIGFNLFVGQAWGPSFQARTVTETLDGNGNTTGKTVNIDHSFSPCIVAFGQVTQNASNQNLSVSIPVALGFAWGWWNEDVQVVPCIDTQGRVSVLISTSLLALR